MDTIMKIIRAIGFIIMLPFFMGAGLLLQILKPILWEKRPKGIKLFFGILFLPLILIFAITFQTWTKLVEGGSKDTLAGAILEEIFSMIKDIFKTV